MAQVCLLSVLRLVLLFFQNFIVQLLVCFALEVPTLSQNIRNGFIIVLVNNEHVFCVCIQHFSSSNYDFQVYWVDRQEICFFYSSIVLFNCLFIFAWSANVV